MRSLVDTYFKNLMVLGFDLFLVLITLPLSLFIRLDLKAAGPWLEGLFPTSILTGFVSYLIAFLIFKSYHAIFRLVSLYTAVRFMCAAFMGACLFYGINEIILQQPVPRSVYLIQLLIVMPLSLSVKFSRRIFERIMTQKVGIRTLIIGGSEATDRWLPVLMRSKDTQYRFIGIIDDLKSRQGCEIQGVKIIGTSKQLRSIITKHNVELVILAMDMPGTKIVEIANFLYGMKIAMKKLPPPEAYLQAVNDKQKVLHDLKIEDLLRRDSRKSNENLLKSQLTGKSILVTGGGGSIGSELVRQIAKFEPKRLVINDASEFNLYTINEEITEKYPKLNLESKVGNLADPIICENIFYRESFDIIFHASAYKHVPLSETSPLSTIRNNILSTINICEEALRSNVAKLLLISSDKAVKPTNVMGATKRLCELVLRRYAEKYPKTTEFACVRFGNVLGSSGSVVPKFKEQILKGGPITVTHPDMERFFMLIPEAVTLVLSTLSYASSGDTCILNMGQPVKIVNLAKDLLKVCGHHPGKDIQIKFTGMRPGEKLIEELQLDHERLEKVNEDMWKVVSAVKLGLPFDNLLEVLISLNKPNQKDQLKKHLFSILHSIDGKPGEPENLLHKTKKQPLFAGNEVENPVMI